ncbi:MAG: hypothetical protein ABI867_36505 [Kofleriaceae bacterium]
MKKHARAALLEVAALLAPRATGFTDELAVALDDPAAYFKRFGRRLRERGIEAATDPELPWLALVTGLEARKRLFEIDWKTDAEDVLWSIDKILWKDKSAERRTRSSAEGDAKSIDTARWAWCDLDRYRDTPTDAFLKVAGKALAADAIELVSIDTGSDAYPLSTLYFGHVREVQRLARASGLGRIDSFAPRTQPAPPRPLPPRPKQPKTSRPKAFRPSSGVDIAREPSSHARGLVFHSGAKTDPTYLAAATSWPATARAIAPYYCKEIAWSPSGAYALNAQYTGDGGAQIGSLREHRDGKLRTLALPAGLDIDRLAYAGDDLVVFPTNPTYRRKRIRRPLIWQGDRFVELAGLPPIKVPPPPKQGQSWDFAVQGHARTGDGSDVIVWGDRGYERAGARWKPTFELGTRDANDEISSAPAGPDGFYLRIDRGVREVVRGKRARHRLRTFHCIDHISPGPGGTLLCALIRMTSKAPAGLVLFPGDDRFAPIPSSAFGLRRDDSLEAIFYDPETDVVFGIVDYPAPGMRPVRWASLLALPRKNEATGR